MKLPITLAVCVVLGLICPPAIVWSLNEADAEATKRLDTVEPKLQFDHTELQNVITYFRSVSGVNFDVRWPQLEAAGAGRDTPVTIFLDDVSIAKALEVVLQSVSAVAPLGYVVHDGIVVVSTEEDLKSRWISTKVQDVTDILGDAPDNRRVGELLDLIRSNIEPDSWVAVGGVIGNIMVFDNLLVTTHSSPVHAAIDGLLADLRAARKDRPPTLQQRAELTTGTVKVVEAMRGAAFEPAAMGLIAVGGLRDDTPRDPADVITDLEAQLVKVKTLGFRNAIRLSLRDLYRQTGRNDKVLEHLRAMLIENDQAETASRGGGR